MQDSTLRQIGEIDTIKVVFSQSSNLIPTHKKIVSFFKLRSRFLRYYEKTNLKKLIMKTTYLVDTEGKKIAVQIPIEEWKLVEEDLKKIRKKNEILKELKESIIEVRTAHKEGRKLKTIEDFLDEL